MGAASSTTSTGTTTSTILPSFSTKTPVSGTYSQTDYSSCTNTCTKSGVYSGTCDSVKALPGAPQNATFVDTTVNTTLGGAPTPACKVSWVEDKGCSEGFSVNSDSVCVTYTDLVIVVLVLLALWYFMYNQK